MVYTLLFGKKIMLVQVQPPAQICSISVSGFKHTSLPVWRGQFESDMLLNAEVAQLVEHDLAKVRVAGSNPVFRSRMSVHRNPTEATNSLSRS